MPEAFTKEELGYIETYSIVIDDGVVTVTCVEEPVERVLAGALILAQDVPDDEYTAIN